VYLCLLACGVMTYLLSTLSHCQGVIWRNPVAQKKSHVFVFDESYSKSVWGSSSGYSRQTKWFWVSLNSNIIHQISEDVRLHECIDVYVQTCVLSCMCCVQLYTCMYVCMDVHVCTYVCLGVQMHVYTSKQRHSCAQTCHRCEGARSHQPWCQCTRKNGLSMLGGLVIEHVSVRHNDT